MRLALAQIASSADRDATLERALEAVREAAEGGASLVVFSEIVLDRFFPARPDEDGRGEAARAVAETIPGPTTEALAAAARAHGIVVVFNLYETLEVDGRTHHFDASPVIDADGTLLGVQRMIHIPDFRGFHERQYYDPGDAAGPALTGSSLFPIHRTAVGPVGVAICYDRHFPEVWRALALGGAQLVVIPQANCLDEFPPGVFEAEVQAMAFQNGVYAALCNRVGVEDDATFAGESFVVDPEGRVIAQAATLEEEILFADVDLAHCDDSPARTVLLRDRRPDLYPDWVTRPLAGAPPEDSP